jgi:DNA polymerase V
MTSGRTHNPPSIDSARPGARSTAGFPSPAEDYIESPLDLNRLLIKRPAATFFMRASGNALRSAGIVDNDLLIVDRAREVASGSIVVALVDGELQAQRFEPPASQVKSDNACDNNLCDDNPYQIWGVVTYVIHEFND